jgi:hypothetical protein
MKTTTRHAGGVEDIIDERIEELKLKLRRSPGDAKAWEAIVYLRRFQEHMAHGPRPLLDQPPARLGVRWLY